jgi:nucleotide-binding universal stress UspA family protein
VLVQVVGQPLEYGGALTQTPRVQDQLLEAALAEASSYLAVLAKSAAFEGVEVATEVLPGAPAEQVLAAVEPHRVDLIVMCSHGQTGFTRWAMGSITRRVVHHSPVPVLVLREKSITSLSQGDTSHPSPFWSPHWPLRGRAPSI